MWLAPLILAGAAASMSPAAFQVPVLRITITVRVYQSAGLPPMLEQRALAEAETVLRSALVDVRWQKCAGLHRSAACAAPPGPSELLLVVRGGTRCEGPRGMLGEALTVHREGGVLAAVHFSCVVWLARAAGTDVAVVLGRVAAHELGHLLQPTRAHAPRGLMRPHWTPAEVRRNRAADWVFTADDVAAMRRSEPKR